VTRSPRAALHPVPDPGPSAALGQLSAILWQERELLEDLLFTLRNQHDVLVGGQTRWLGRADAAVAATTRAVQTVEVLRAIEVEGLVTQLGLEPNASLREIAEAASEPWRDVLCEHREALRSLATEVDEATEGNRVLLAEGEQATREALEV
jgi:hypothetical protein